MGRREELHRLVRDFRNYVEHNQSRTGMRAGSLPAGADAREAFEASKKAREAKRLEAMKRGFSAEPPRKPKPARKPSTGHEAPRKPAQQTSPTRSPEPQPPATPQTPTTASSGPDAPAPATANTPAPRAASSKGGALWKEFGSRPKPTYAAKFPRKSASAPVAEDATRRESDNPARGASPKADSRQPATKKQRPAPSSAPSATPGPPPGPPPEAYEYASGPSNAGGPPPGWEPPPVGDMSAQQKRDGKAWSDDSLPAAEKLGLLRDLLGDCQRCGLCETRTNIVFGEGFAEARLMFIGEAPGYNEDKQARPFVGKAGELLDRMVKAMGFERHEIYIANVIKCRPPKNRDPSPDEVLACSPFMLQQVQAIKPDVIVALGRFAVNTLLERQGPLRQVRGKWQEFEGVPVMPTYHPAYLLRNPEAKRPTWEDLQKVMEKLDG